MANRSTMTTVVNPVLIAILVLSFLTLLSCKEEEPETFGQAEEDNIVVAFFDDAYAEVDSRQDVTVIMTALEDALSLPTAELRQRRYPDYEGTPNAWSLPTLLERYFMPGQAIALDSAKFFDDIGKAAARDAIRGMLNKLQDDFDGGDL